MSSNQAVLATLVVYKLVLILIGVLASRRTHDGADFFLGGRSLGPFVAALSASASSSSVWTLLGVSGAAYAWGLGALWLFPACVGGFVVNWCLLAPRLRELSRENGSLTVTEMLAGPADSPLRQTNARVASAIIVLSLATYVATQFQGAGKTFSETFGMGMTESVLLGAGIVVFYTMLGGFWAVSLTDALQGTMMVATAIILPVAAVAAVGGPAGLLEGLQTQSPEYLSLTRGLGPAAGLGFVMGVLGIGLGYPGQPHVVNRFMALKDERALARGRVVAIAWGVVVYAGMLLVGLSGRLLLPGLADKEVVFLATTQELFPPVMAGVMIAAVLSAIMSTADSQLLVVVSSLTYDLNLGRPTEGLVGRSRLVILAVSTFSVLAALFGPPEIFSFVLFAWSAMGAAFGPLLLVTVLRGPVRPGFTLAAMSVGFVSSVAAYLTVKGPFELVIPFCLALGIAWAGCQGPSSTST